MGNEKKCQSFGLVTNVFFLSTGKAMQIINKLHDLIHYACVLLLKQYIKNDTCIYSLHQN